MTSVYGALIIAIGLSMILVGLHGKKALPISSPPGESEMQTVGYKDPRGFQIVNNILYNPYPVA